MTLRLALLLAALVGSACSRGGEDISISLRERLRSRLYVAGFVDVGAPADGRLLVDGWFPPEVRQDGSTWAWMSGARSTLHLPVDRRLEGRLHVLASPPPFLDGEASLEVLLNGRSLGEQPLSKPRSRLSFDVPAGLLHRGLNDLELRSSRTGRPADHSETSTDQRELGFFLDHVLLCDPSEEPETRLARISERVPGAAGSPLELRAEEMAFVRALVPDGGTLELRGHDDMELLLIPSFGGTSGPLEVLRTGPRSSHDLDSWSRRPLQLALAVPEGRERVRVEDVLLRGRQTPPNLIMVVVDTLRADHVSDPEQRVATPNLDQLLADSVVFPNAFSHAPLTLPAHTSLFSSRYPHVTGVTNNNHLVGKDVPLLAEWLRAAGFDTRGVIAIGTLWPRVPEQSLKRGFESYDHAFVDLPPAPDVNRRTLPVLPRLREPFFLFVHYSDPHTPYRAHGGWRRTAQFHWNGELVASKNISEGLTWERPVSLHPGRNTFEIKANESFLLRRLSLKDAKKQTIPFEFEEGQILGGSERVRMVVDVLGAKEVAATLSLWISDHFWNEEGKERYRREVEYVDDSIGELIDELKERGLYDSSLIVFTSDHGEALGEHNWSGHSITVYDEVLHIPLAMKLPAECEQREALEQRSERLARHIDVVPTVLEMLRVPPLPGQMGRPLTSDEARLHLGETHPPEAPQSVLSLRDESFKLIFFAGDDRFELYHVAEDPGEEHDLFPEMGERFSAWQQQLRNILELKSSASAGEMPLDADTIEALRGLGYLGG